MVQFGAIVRLLMLAACLVPFTNTRQAAEACAPLFPSSSALAPVAPGGEEDDERETDPPQRLSAEATYRSPLRELIDTLPPARASHLNLPSRIRTTPPVAADPFRNGLGTPYRC